MPHEHEPSPLPRQPRRGRGLPRCRVVAGRDRLRAGGDWVRAGGDRAAARVRRLRSAAARLVPRTSRPGHLHRRLPAGVRPGGRAAASAPTWSARSKTLGVPIVRYPGRQFRVRLQLAGRRRSEGAAADGPRPGLELARDESVRDERLHRLVPRSSAPSRCSG